MVVRRRVDSSADIAFGLVSRALARARARALGLSRSGICVRLACSAPVVFFQSFSIALHRQAC